MKKAPTVVGVAFLVLLAGCSLSPGTPSPTDERTGRISSPTSGIVTPSTEASPISVRGGPLPVDPYAVWQRTQRLLGTNVTPPDRIVVDEPTAESYEVPPHYQLLTGCGDQQLDAKPGGRVDGPSAVRLYVDPDTPAVAVEGILVHEYAHVVQFRQQVPGNLSRNVLGAVLQGGAHYAAEAYAREHHDGDPHGLADPVTRYRDASPCRRTVFAGSYFGYRYVDGRIDSPEELGEVYANPPRTSEQLLHNLSPGTEPPRSLPVDVDGTAEWTLFGNRTVGELGVRSVLWTHLPRDRARMAATGWGNDRLLQFGTGSTDGHVWLLRWDDASDAAEFADAVGDYFDRRATPATGGWTDGTTRFEVKRTSPETVAVVAGTEAFVESVDVDQSDGTVTVSIESDRSSSGLGVIRPG